MCGLRLIGSSTAASACHLAACRVLHTYGMTQNIRSSCVSIGSYLLGLGLDGALGLSFRPARDFHHGRGFILHRSIQCLSVS